MPKIGQKLGPIFHRNFAGFSAENICGAICAENLAELGTYSSAELNIAIFCRIISKKLQNTELLSIIAEFDSDFY